MDEKQAAALREPFPKELIGHLPKGGVTLDYVGHAATTDRLLKVDPDWTWHPVAYDERGLPRLDEHGGLWIVLEVCGVKRHGYGAADGKKGPNAVKEAIGDAIRNAAMRFGVALDLWAKEDLKAGDDVQPPAQRSSPSRPRSASTQPPRQAASPTDAPHGVETASGDGAPNYPLSTLEVSQLEDGKLLATTDQMRLLFAITKGGGTREERDKMVRDAVEKITTATGAPTRSPRELPRVLVDAVKQELQLQMGAEVH